MCGEMPGRAGALGGGPAEAGRPPGPAGVGRDSAAMEGDDQSAEGDDGPCPEHEHPFDQLGAELRHPSLELHRPAVDLGIQLGVPLFDLGVEVRRALLDLGVELRRALLDLGVELRRPLLKLGVEPGEVELVELPKLATVSHVHLVKSPGRGPTSQFSAGQLLFATSQSPGLAMGILPRRATLLLCTLLGARVAPAAAQAPRQFPAADSARAARMLGPSLNPLVVGGSVTANWLADDRFWYRNQTAAGYEFVLLDPARRTRAPAFDHTALAAALSVAAGARYRADSLPFQSFAFSKQLDSVSFDVGERRWSCDARGTRCVAGGAARPTGQGGGGPGGRGGSNVPSPDGKRPAFIRDWNLWVRDVATGQEKQLTTDGVKDFGYATDNAGWVRSDRPILLWSPDSKKIATQQQDERRVGEMYLVQTKVGHPALQAWKYPLPGDSVVAMIHRVIIDVDAGRVVRLQMPPDFHRAMLGDNLSMADLSWSPDRKSTRLNSSHRT